MLFRDPDLSSRLFSLFKLSLMAADNVLVLAHYWISHATCYFFFSQQQSFFFQEKSSHQASATVVAPQRVPVDPGKVDRLNN